MLPSLAPWANAAGRPQCGALVRSILLSAEATHSNVRATPARRAVAKPLEAVTIATDGTLSFAKTESDSQKKKDKDLSDRFLFGDDEIGWGTKFLSDHDPAWSDPEYLQRLREFASPAITNYNGRAEKLWTEYGDYFDKFFRGKVHQVMSSGTDANNYLFLWARQFFKYRHGREPVNMKFISFGDVYGGSYGPIRDDRVVIYKNPTIEPGQTFTKEQLLEQEQAEQVAIGKIEEAIQDPSFDAGAIFLEPMPAAQGGVKVYRIEFIKKLSELSDRLDVPIYCDEILTGGGRTGKFWAFQHYQNDGFRFVPDLVTFGKGLGASGIFKPHHLSPLHNETDVLERQTVSTSRGYTERVRLKGQRQIDYIHSTDGDRILFYEDGKLKRETQFRGQNEAGKPTGIDSRSIGNVLLTGYPATTTQMNALALLQSLQIVKTIWNRRLDLNAAEAGRHLNLRVQQARRYGEKNTPGQIARHNPVPTGIGLIFKNFGQYEVKTSLAVELNQPVGYHGRLLMLLSTTKADIDWLLSEKWGWRFDQDAP